MDKIDPTAIIDAEVTDVEQVDEEGLALLFKDGEWKAMPLDGVKPCSEEALWEFAWQYIGLRMKPEFPEDGE